MTVSVIARAAGSVLVVAFAGLIAACGGRLEAPGPSAGGAALDREPGVLHIDPCAGNLGEDSDQDRLTDGCELALVTAFAPVLVVDRAACNYDAKTGLLRGGWLWGAQPLPDGAVRVAYLPAYEVDCGWQGPKCWVLFRECRGHAGDSEAIGLELERSDGDSYRVRRVFLSGHCFADAACRWYSGDELNLLEWRGGVPVVWVARGKNANYPSRQSCDRGKNFMDTCDRNDAVLRFPVEAGRNIGSAARPFSGRGDCISHPDGREAGPRECFWSERPFRGWQDRTWAEPPTPYHHYLRILLPG